MKLRIILNCALPLTMYLYSPVFSPVYSKSLSCIKSLFKSSSTQKAEHFAKSLCTILKVVKLIFSDIILTPDQEYEFYDAWNHCLRASEKSPRDFFQCDKFIEMLNSKYVNSAYDIIGTQNYGNNSHKFLDYVKFEYSKLNDNNTDTDSADSHSKCIAMQLQFLDCCIDICNDSDLIPHIKQHIFIH